MKWPFFQRKFFLVSHFYFPIYQQDEIFHPISNITRAIQIEWFQLFEYVVIWIEIISNMRDYNFPPQVKNKKWKKKWARKGQWEKLTLRIESDALIFSKQRQNNFQQFDTHVDLDSMWTTPSTLHSTPLKINCMCRMGHTTHLLFQKWLGFNLL